MKRTILFMAVAAICGNALAFTISPSSTGTNSTGIGATTPGGSGIITSISSSNSVAVGEGSGASDSGVAIGVGTTAGANGVAVGTRSSADNNAVAIGSGSVIEGSNVGIGNNQSAIAVDNSVALGNNTSVSRSNEVAIGGRTIGGVSSAVSSDQATNLGQTISLVNTGVEQAVSQSKNYTDKMFDKSRGLAYSAAAIGMASSGLVFNPNLERQIAVAVANVNGANAISFGIAWKHGATGFINIKGSTSNGMNGVSVGYTMGF